MLLLGKLWVCGYFRPVDIKVKFCEKLFKKGPKTPKSLLYHIYWCANGHVTKYSRDFSSNHVIKHLSRTKSAGRVILLVTIIF